MLEGIEAIFADRAKMLDSVKRASFEERTERFEKEHGHFFEEMTVLIEQSDHPEAVAEEIGECLVRAARLVGVNKKGKLDARSRAQLHMFMIYYVFPTMLKRGDAGRMAADGVLRVWREKMDNPDMSYTDYNTLYYGFREKKFGLF